jgi:DNA repair protein RecO
MPNITDTGFILRKIPYSESSLILKAYTREHGVVSFMAKGAKRQNSRLHGLLEPVVHLQFLFPAQSRGEMRILSDVALLHDHPGVREDIVKQALAQACGEVLLKYMPDEARAPDFHDELLKVMGRLEAAPALRRALEVVFAGYLLDFCRLSGFQPQFRFCVRCDARVFGPTVAEGAAVSTGQTIPFAIDQGGPVCNRCHRESDETGGVVRLREGILRWLDGVQDLDPATLASGTFLAVADASGQRLPDISWRDAEQAEEFLLHFLGRHAGGQKPVKSLGVWRALME